MNPYGTVLTVTIQYHWENGDLNGTCEQAIMFLKLNKNKTYRELSDVVSLHVELVHVDAVT